MEKLVAKIMKLMNLRIKNKVKNAETLNLTTSIQITYGNYFDNLYIFYDDDLILYVREGNVEINKIDKDVYNVINAYIERRLRKWEKLV